MNGKYKTYDKYKPSGVEWLGKIPEHWEAVYLKNVGQFASSGIDKKIVDGEPLVKMVNYTDIYGNSSHVIDKSRELMTVSCPVWKISEANLITGDLVFTPSSETIEDIGVSALILENLPNTVFSYHVVRFRFSNDFHHGFKKYCCNNDFVLQQFSKSAKGTTRQILNRDDFKNIYVVRPPKDEQQGIADFLDERCGRIDELIKKKERLIELLKEKRTAIISHAVTKGLDPKAKMKDSGVEWLGKIPEHWETPPLYARYTVKLGKMLDAKRISGEHLVPYLRNIDVQWGRINTEDLPEMDIEPSEYARFMVTNGDLLVCEGGEVGRTAIWRDEINRCGYQKALHRVRPRSSRDIPRFFYYIMCTTAASGVFVAGGNPNTIPHLTAEKLRVYRFPFPPTVEQERIVTHLDHETGKIDNLIAKVEQAIEKLKEYRTALISAAVTGKIDVRERDIV